MKETPGWHRDARSLSVCFNSHERRLMSIDGRGFWSRGKKLRRVSTEEWSYGKSLIIVARGLRGVRFFPSVKRVRDARDGPGER